MKTFYLIVFSVTAFILQFFNPVTTGFSVVLPSVTNFITLILARIYLGSKGGEFESEPINKWEKLFAVLFGICLTLGHGLSKGSGFEVFYKGLLPIAFLMVSLVVYCGLSIRLMKFLLHKSESWLSAKESSPLCPKSRFVAYLYEEIEKNRLGFYFIFFALAWLIPYLINLPGIMMYDTRNQLAMYYHIPNHHTNASVLIDESQYITQHHSVPHTFLVGFLFDLGRRLFASHEVGAFMYTLLQYLTMALIVGYMFKSIRQYLGVKWTFAALVLFGLHPYFAISSILLTKDIYFCGFFILYMLKYYELVREPDKFKKPGFFAGFLAITIALLLLRNNALYTLVLTSPVLLFTIKRKGCLILYTVAFIAFNMCYTSLLPHLGISPGSPREALSIPFQQTANYVNKYEGEVTPEEREAISKILDYETLKSQYDPEKSDAIKDTFNKHSTSEDLKDYLVVWGKMLIKHPASYFEAFFNQNYGYYYVGAKENSMNYHAKNSAGSQNAMIRDGITHLKHKKPNLLEKAYFYVQYAAYYTPFICLLVDTGVYVWIWLFVIVLTLKHFKEKKKYLLYFVPYFAYLVFILVGPVNGTIYIRYVMPFIYTLPLMLLPLFEHKNQTEAAARL
ncbi:MAG: hypothetical protein E7395_02050 [Ruminococcaceae bacterium]|nr:hypothetical protein [Oscillospiraceae bacterium]